jgi:hypothetical protein
VFVEDATAADREPHDIGTDDVDPQPFTVQPGR